MRIIFAGTPTFAAIQLQALIDAKFNIVAVYTQPDRHAGRGQHLHQSEVKALALKHNIPVEQPSTLKTSDAQTTLAAYQADVMVVAAYGLLLPESILTTPKFGCINVHASLLPRWRGASPIQQAILAGDKETGITLMQMDVGLDTGDILTQASCPITIDDTSAILHEKLAHLGATLLVEKLLEITQTPKPRKQDQSLATHAGKITKEQALIDWNTPAIEINRKIRAFNPWPIAHTHIGNEMIRIWKSYVIDDSTFFPRGPGTIRAHDPKGIIVESATHLLLLTHAQLPGKKMLPMTEILRGHPQLFGIGQQFK